LEGSQRGDGGPPASPGPATSGGTGMRLASVTAAATIAQDLENGNCLRLLMATDSFTWQTLFRGGTVCQAFCRDSSVLSHSVIQA
jgi:hypothetical protein